MGSACSHSTTPSSSSPTTSCSRSRPRPSASASDCYRSTTATAPSGKRNERPRWPTDGPVLAGHDRDHQVVASLADLGYLEGDESLSDPTSDDWPQVGDMLCDCRI